MPDLDQSIRERVIALHQHTSKSHRDIANDLGLCQSTVTRLINRYQRLGTTATSRHKRCGRKSKLTTHDKRLLIRESVKDPTKTAQEIQKAVGNSVLNVSKRSIQRVLIAGGRKCYRPKKVHMLDQVKILRRYNWARRHSHKTQDFWNTVIFTDEVMVEVGQTKVQYIRRTKDEPLRDAHFSHLKGYVTKVMFWGAISVFGPLCLVPVSGMMNSEKYIHILETFLLPSAAAVFGDHPWKLLQDAAPCHTAKRTMRFFEENHIHLVEWPKYSPDMNTIENVWSLLKHKLYRLGSGSNRDDVISHAKTIWEEDDQLREMAINCVSSMSSRVSKLFANKGGHTLY